MSKCNSSGRLALTTYQLDAELPYHFHLQVHNVSVARISAKDRTTLWTKEKNWGKHLDRTTVLTKEKNWGNHLDRTTVWTKENNWGNHLDRTTVWTKEKNCGNHLDRTTVWTKEKNCGNHLVGLKSMSWTLF